MSVIVKSAQGHDLTVHYGTMNDSTLILQNIGVGGKL